MPRLLLVFFHRLATVRYQYSTLNLSTQLCRKEAIEDSYIRPNARNVLNSRIPMLV